MKPIDDVDIAVVGGGLVGTPLAIMLARLGWSVALFEQQGSEQIALGTRGYTAISDSTVAMLKAQQLWNSAADDACAIHRVHVSHKGYFGSTQIDGASLGVDALGYVVDNVGFLSAFQDVLQSSSVHRFIGANVQSVDYAEQDASVHYEQDKQISTLRARLVIAVDGVSSRLRDAAGIATKQTDYDQVGVLGLVSLSQSHNNVAYERFTPSGPLALLPRPNNTASFVYCINPSMQDELQAMDDAAFSACLQSAFGYRVGQFETVGPRHFVPLVRIEASKQVSHRLLLMGNALRLLHPVAGQGYNLAMRDVDSLLTALSHLDTDPGEAKMLEDFAQSRQKDHEQVVRLTDLLARTFRGSASLPAHVRALGLLGLDRVPALRNRFSQRSMGHLHG